MKDVRIPGGLFSSRRRREHLLRRPTASIAAIETICMYAEFFRPCANTLSLSVKRNHYVSSSIAILAFLCLPTNVVSLVVAAIVNSVKRIAFFAAMGKRSHIIVERLKVVFPFFGNANTAPAIIRKRIAIWIIATLQHAYPNLVEWRFGHAVSSSSLRYFDASNTAARLSVSSTKRIRYNFNRISAIATTKPNGSTTLIRSENTNDYELAESLIANVFTALVSDRGILRLHKNLHFLCLIRGRFADAARYFCCLYSCKYSTKEDFSLCLM
jgi:hypothetical protein